MDASACRSDVGRWVKMGGGGGGAQLLFRYVRSVASAVRTVPFPARLGGEADAAEMKPFNRTVQIVAANHLAEADLLTDTVGRLVRIDRRLVERIGRTVVQISLRRGAIAFDLAV